MARPPPAGGDDPGPQVVDVGAAGAAARLLEPALVGVEAQSVPLFRISAARASALPPAPAQASTTVLPGRAPQASAMSCEPSSWISKSAGLEGREREGVLVAVERRAPGAEAGGRAGGPLGRPGAPGAPRAWSTSRLARTVSGARSLRTATSAPASASPSSSTEAGRQPARQRPSQRQPVDGVGDRGQAGVGPGRAAGARCAGTPSRRAASSRVHAAEAAEPGGVAGDQVGRAATRPAPRRKSSCPCQRVRP